MADAARARRLAKRIVAVVATELEHQVKDPRLAMVTVTAARVTPDLRDATVYYTVYGDATAATDTAAALASATGVLRSAVGRQMGIKFTPTLTFVPDIVPEHSQHIERLLVAARASDAAVARQAAGASFAGDPDPYRQPRPADDEAADDEAADDGADGDAGDGDGDTRGGDAGDGDTRGGGTADGTDGRAAPGGGVGLP